MNSENNIYKDIGNTKWYYIDHIDVLCPKCSRKATLQTPNSNRKQPDLKCNQCYYSKKGYEYTSFSKIQKVVCENCNSVFDLETEKLLKSVEKANCKCPDCNHMNQVKIKFDLYENGDMYSRQAKDQFYNLEFWYKTNIKNHCFWAFNLEHLNEIEKYLSAGIRKRHHGNYQSMVERLPKWIINKKNRTVLLKAIKKMKKQQ